MLPESAKKLREPIAALLLGAVVLYLITVLAELLDDEGTFGQRALFLQDRFVNPAWVLVPVAAALLVTLGGERTGRARVIVLAALAVLGLMALLAVISWLAGLGADADFRFGFGKITGSFLMIAGLVVLAAALWLLFSLFRSLPAPVRTPKTPQQQWGGGQPQQQQQWGGQPQQQWGGQPPPAPAASWTAPPAGQPQQPQPQQSAPPPAQSWGQQAPPEQQSWGQPPPQPPPPQPPAPQPPTDEPPAQPGGATAVSAPEERSEAPTAEGDSTAVWTQPPPAEQPAAAPEAPRREDEDDSRPGWWNPGS